MITVNITADALAQKLKRQAWREGRNLSGVQTLSGRQLRALLELADKAESPLAAKLDNVREVAGKHTIGLTNDEIRLLYTLALEGMHKPLPQTSPVEGEAKPGDEDSAVKMPAAGANDT